MYSAEYQKISDEVRNMTVEQRSDLVSYLMGWMRFQNGREEFAAGIRKFILTSLPHV
jgi:hypothetical protein